MLAGKNDAKDRSGAPAKPNLSSPSRGPRICDRATLTRPPVSSEIRRKRSRFLTGGGWRPLPGRALWTRRSSSAPGDMFVLTWLLGPHVYGLTLVAAIALTSVLANLVRGGLVTCISAFGARRIPRPPRLRYGLRPILSFSPFRSHGGGGMAVDHLCSRAGFTAPEVCSTFLVTLLTIPIVGLARLYYWETRARFELPNRTAPNRGSLPGSRARARDRASRWRFCERAFGAPRRGPSSFGGSFRPALRAFRAARCFSPGSFSIAVVMAKCSRSVSAHRFSTRTLAVARVGDLH